MPPRFTYRRLSPDEFRSALDAMGWSAGTFARIFGANVRRVQQWLHGEEEPPPWVAVVIGLLKDKPHNVVEARQIAAEMILHDNLRPELGEYPYLEQEGDADEDA